MLELPTLRGLGDELSGLPDMAKALGNLLTGGNSDNIAFIKKKILENPDYASELSQLSKDNPELYGALKLGKYGDTLAKTPKSSDTVYKESRQQQELQKGQLDIKTAQTDSELAPVRASILNMQRDKLALDAKDLELQSKGFPGINFKKAVDDFTSGKQSSDTQAVMSNPHSMDLFKQMVGYKKQSEQIQAAADRQTAGLNAAMNRQDTREDKQREKGLIDQGKSFTLKYGVGTPQTWAVYLDDPQTQAMANHLIDHPDLAKGNQYLENLRDIAKKRQFDKNMDGVVERTKVIGQVNGMLKDIGNEKYSKEELPTAIQNINQQLEMLGQLGGRQMKMVRENDLPTTGNNPKELAWWTKPSLRTPEHSDKPILVDAHTNQKLDADKLGVIAEQPSSPDFSPKQITNTEELYAPYKGTVNWTAAVENLKKTQPKMYEILVQRGFIPSYTDSTANTDSTTKTKNSITKTKNSITKTP